MKFPLGLIVLFFVASCSEDLQPKPQGYFRLDYPNPTYQKADHFYFTFDQNTFSKTEVEKKQAPKIVYPQMKATLYLNYNAVQNNLDSLLNDAYRLPYKHLSKADAIPEKIFINEDKRVFGTLFSVVGNAASQHQFYLTDSLQHFLVGSLYFYAKPNYDSLYPAVYYLEKDIIRLMETVEWKQR
jgi:gliding motility-associated lipoprotein GldD